MNKIKLYLLLIVLCIFLVGCKDEKLPNDNEEISNQEISSISTQPEPEVSTISLEEGDHYIEITVPDKLASSNYIWTSYILDSDLPPVAYVSTVKNEGYTIITYKAIREGTTVLSLFYEENVEEDPKNESTLEYELSVNSALEITLVSSNGVIGEEGVPTPLIK